MRELTSFSPSVSDILTVVLSFVSLYWTFDSFVFFVFFLLAFASIYIFSVRAEIDCSGLANLNEGEYVNYCSDVYSTSL